MAAAEVTTITAPRPRKPAPKKTKAPKIAPLSLSEIEALAGGPIDFNSRYDQCDEAVRRKLFATAAAQQFRDYVNHLRTPTKVREAVTDDNLPQYIQRWVPEIKRRGIGPVVKASKLVAAMTPEEKAELAKLLAQ